jgi:ABC-type lipoprotein release transport system permease subunit
VLVLGWRNIWRQRSRSLAAVIAVAFVVWLGLAYFGVVAASRDGMVMSLTETVGHVQIHTRHYREVRNFRDAVIPNAAALGRRILATLPGVEVAAALEVPALLAGETRSRGVLLTGLEQPPALRDRFAASYLAEGRLPTADERDGIALGGGLARTLQVGPGDTVYAYAPGTEGTGASAYTVVGLLHFPEPSRDARTAVLSLPAAQELAAPGAVSRFELHVPEFRHTTDDAALTPLRARLQAALGSTVIVETWREAFPALNTLERLMRPLVVFFVGLFFILAGLLVVNTIYLSVIERTREFGVIIALGARRGRIMRMVLAESLALCGTGAGIGLALGLATLARLARGFSYPGLREAFEQIGLPPVMYASIEPAEVGVIVAFALATAVLAAAWPAWVAGRLEPVDAMRFVA